MAEYRLMPMRTAGKALCLCALFLSSSCSTLQPPEPARSAAARPMVPETAKPDPFVTDNIQQLRRKQPSRPLPEPDYQRATDDISPAKSRLVNIQTRNSSLGDVLHVIADAAGLNLVINDGVQQDRPVTITLKRVTAEDALTTILGATDYFFTIKNNILTVEATGTKIFELGHPALVSSYTVDVGGDILGSATSSASGNSSGSSANIKGTITQSSKADAKAFDFWETLEKTLQEMLGKQDTSGKKEREALSPTATAPRGLNTAQNINITGGIQPAQQQSPPVGMLHNASSGALLTGDQTTPPANRGSDGPRQYVAINRLAGTIIVTATRKNLLNIENYLEQLKTTLNRQVMIDARIIEVQLDESLEFGIDWKFLATTGLAQVGGGFGAVGETTLSASLNSAAPSFRIGAMRSGSNTISGLLTALKTQGDVKTLSNPRINVMNGQTALLSVGRNFNYISKVTTTSTNTVGSNPTVTYSVEVGNVLSGVLLGLVPAINSKGEIKLTVTPIVSDLVDPGVQTIGTDSTNQVKISLPVVDLRELSTTVQMRDGEVIVIGGLIANKQDYTDKKIPVLGDIPFVGNLFTQQKKHANKRTELIVVLKPHLIQND